MTTKEFVKLYVYEFEKERIIVDSIEAERWEDLLIVKVSPPQMDESLHEIHNVLKTRMPDKQVIFIQPDGDMCFYGVRIEKDDRPTDSQL